MTLRRSSKEHLDGSDGFVLVAVLGLLLIISAVLLSFSISTRIQAQVANNALRSFQYEKAAEAVAQVFMSKQSPESIRRILRGTHFAATEGACLAGVYSILIGIQDHAGLIDLNTAGGSLLGLGFQALGFSEKESENLANAAIQYRQPSDAKSDHAFDEFFGDAGPKHALFEDVAELYDIKAIAGLSPGVLYNTFTVQTQSGVLANDSMSPVIRRALASHAGMEPPNLVTTSVPRAITLSVEFRRNERPEFLYAGVFRFVADQPIFIHRVPGLLDQSEPSVAMGRLLPCPELLDTQVVSALGEVLP